MQGLHRWLGLGTRRVGKGEQLGRLPVDGDEEAGRALPRQLLGGFQQKIQRGAEHAQKIRRADRDVSAIDLSAHAKAGLVGEMRDLSHSRAPPCPAAAAPPPTSARPRGYSERASTAAASPSSFSASKPSPGKIRVRAGRPSVSVRSCRRRRF